MEYGPAPSFLSLAYSTRHFAVFRAEHNLEDSDVVGSKQHAVSSNLLPVKNAGMASENFSKNRFLEPSKCHYRQMSGWYHELRLRPTHSSILSPNLSRHEP